MRYLFTIMPIFVGLMLGGFSHAWSGEIEGQVLRAASGGKVIPVADVGFVVYQPVPGLPECEVTAETKVGFTTTDADGMFSTGDLKTGLYQICGQYDYEVDDPESNRKITVSLAKRIRVPSSGTVKVIFKK